MTSEQGRCDGRYPVPQTSPPREESFGVTYRCALSAGHSWPHGDGFTKDDETPMAQLRGCMNRIEQEGDACRNCGHLESEHRLVTWADGQHFDPPELICPVAHVFEARTGPPLLHELHGPSPWQPERDLIVLALLGKLAEELGEASAIVARCMIQGVSESEPVTGMPNADALENELADVSAAGNLVIEHFGFSEKRMDARYDRKRAHLKAWHRLIRDAGTP